MFTTLEALDSVKHRTLCLQPQGFSFAATATTVPLSGSEFIEAAKYYPIVFPPEGYAPQALFSLKNGRNLFVTAEGQWTVPYVPAHLRRHPFIFSRNEGNGQAIVLIDRAASSLKDGEGERLFDDSGKPSPLLSQVVAFLRAFQAEAEATAALMASLDGILVERQIEVEIQGQAKQVLNGFRVIDVEKFSTLPDTTFLAWRRSGLLPLVYAHFASMSNVQRLAELQARNEQ